jgi:hypothetical protein
MVRHARLVGATGVLIAATISLGGQAQKPAAEQSLLMQATIVTVKPGMGAQYTDLQIKEVMPGQQKGGASAREAWSSGAFGQPGVFAFFYPVPSLARFDSPSPLTQGLGQEGAAALVAKTAALTQASRTLLIRTRPDLSHRPDPKTGPLAFAVISEIDVAPGRRADFEMLLKKEVLPVMQQAKVRSYAVSEVVYGGNVGTYFTAVSYDTYEAIGKGHPFQIVLGEDGTRRLEAKFTGIVTRLERFVMRFRSDLSYPPAKPGTN